MEFTPKTIRVDREKWDRFKKICKAKNLDASKQIRIWIDEYLAQNNQLYLELEAKRLAAKEKS